LKYNALDKLSSNLAMDLAIVKPHKPRNLKSQTREKQNIRFTASSHRSSVMYIMCYAAVK
jgi:hypothetical protein